jgi:outer membrane protein OmpA-like peptidoglycan-associated protein
MKPMRFIFFFCVILFTLQGCTLLCNECRSVEYICTPCKKAPKGTFPRPCPVIKFPGFHKPNFGCLGNLKRFTTLRQRGIGVIVLGDRLRFIIPADSLFTRDSIEVCAPAEISECQVANLANIGEIIRCIPGVPVIITGHTDNVGRRSELYRRSRSMAEAVAAFLWAQGVTSDRLRIIGRADCDPIASDASVFGSTDNRRVEIRLDFSGNYIYNCRYNNVYCPDCVCKG